MLEEIERGEGLKNCKVGFNGGVSGVIPLFLSGAKVF